ncbi:MAG: sterol desaturase family protein, partial [Gemmataceae bacterium]|nr:sterol desaturase family protein [Gemmataceae bacterium]
MDWLTTLAGVWITTLGWMAAAAVVLAVLSRLWPCNPGRSWWADLRAARTDLGYWLLNPALTGAGRVGLLVAGTLLVYGGEPPADLPARRLPLWAQCGLVLLIQDVILYAVHRAFHTRRGWGFHAVHHSPEPLDWPSALRFHPVNAVLEFAAADAAVLLMGFSPTALLALAPFSLAFSVLVHANLDWTFGPLRYVIASPVFHRWHHTSAEAGRDRNFASTFPFLDLLFGTFYLPAGERPRAYGAGDPAFPAGLWAQWAYPFRRAGGRAAAAVGGAAGCLA